MDRQGVSTMPDAVPTPCGEISDETIDCGQSAPFSRRVLRCLTRLVRGSFSNPRVAEFGLGTTGLVHTLEQLELSGYAIESNPLVRDEAGRFTPTTGRFGWRDGTAEASGLPDRSIHWAILGNAFHFADRTQVLRECRRILKAHGFLTVIWLLRDPANDPLQEKLDHLMRRLAPKSRRIDGEIDDIMTTFNGHTDLVEAVYIESREAIQLPRERLLSTWQANHDVSKDVSEAAWQELAAEVERLVPGTPHLTTHWWTRAWTFRLTR